MLKKNFTKNIVTVFVLLFLCFELALAQEAKFKVYPGEELVYKVKWSFVKLGTLRLQLFETDSSSASKRYQSRLFVDSNPLLFFVNMHSVYETFLDDKLRPTLHQAYENIDNVNYFTQHYFDYKDSTIYLKMTSVEDTSKIIEKTFPLVDNYYDALSLVYYTRSRANLVETDTVKSFFGQDIGKVAINFHDSQDKMDSDYKDTYDKMYFVDGTFLMKGVAGLTGPFEGWFAGSEKRIPVKAKLKVFIGNVTLDIDSVNHVIDKSYNISRYKK
jgi:hypothetical protein